MRSLKERKTEYDKLGNNLRIIIYTMILLMIASYFTISKVVMITQAFKMGVRLLLTIWAVIILYRLHSKGFQTGLEITNRMALWLYFLYLLLGFASFLWTTNIYFSALQWLMIVQSLVQAYLLYRIFLIYNWYFSNRPIRMTNVFSISVFIIASILLIGSVVAPDIFYRATHGGTEQRLGGYLMNPNELGMLTSLGSAVAFLELGKAKNKWFIISILIVNFIALVLTSSRSSVIGFLIVVTIIVNRTASAKVKFFVYMIIALAIPPLVQLIIFKQGNVEEVMNMTGRLPFWKALLNEGIVKEPWLGFGFQRIYYTERFVSLFAYPGMMTHNAFLQVLMNLGFIGFAVAIAQIVFTVRGVVNIKNIEYGNIFLAFIIPLIINSLTEFGIFGNANYAIFFYQLLIFIVVLRPKTHLNSYEYIKELRLRKYYGLPKPEIIPGTRPPGADEIIEQKTLI